MFVQLGSASVEVQTEVPEFVLVVVFMEHSLTIGGERLFEFLNDWDGIERLGDKDVGPTFGV